VANGEIWTLADALRAREESDCFNLMLGRGIVTNPGLGWAIQSHDQGGGAKSDVAWQELAEPLMKFWHLVGERVSPRHQAGRLKQWLNMMRRHYPQAEDLYQTLRTVNDPTQVSEHLKMFLDKQATAA